MISKLFNEKFFGFILGIIVFITVFIIVMNIVSYIQLREPILYNAKKGEKEQVIQTLKVKLEVIKDHVTNDQGLLSLYKETNTCVKTLDESAKHLKDNMNYKEFIDLIFKIDYSDCGAIYKDFKDIMIAEKNLHYLNDEKFINSILLSSLLMNDLAYNSLGIVDYTYNLKLNNDDCFAIYLTPLTYDNSWQLKYNISRSIIDYMEEKVGLVE